MQVLATAGHVDHGKSTLVRALTGVEPDRWEEERRRGLSIGLGYAWTTMPGVGDVAFVDVPGHERFVSTMLSGVGPVPAVLFVVAADEGWMPQSTEHLAALDALDVRHGLLVVTRADLADPELAMEEAGLELADSCLRDAPRIGVSARTGAGMPELERAIRTMLGGLPQPDPRAPVRFWVDRAFSVSGAGTVVTGTLPAGTIGRGDKLRVVGAAEDVNVREMECLGRQVDQASGASRVALNLRGTSPERVPRGSVLVTDGAWTVTMVVDVRVAGAADLPAQVIVHAGSVAVPARVRPLADDLVRIQLARDLPLHVGDRLIARDPGSRRVTGLTVLDPVPPQLARRGDARRRAAALADHPGVPDGALELARRGVIRSQDLRALGADPQPGAADEVAGGWLVDPHERDALVTGLVELVEAYAVQHPLEDGVPVEVVRQELELPERRLVHALVEDTGGRVVVRDGRLTTEHDAVPAELARLVEPLLAQLEADPFAAPDADTLGRWGIGNRELAAANRLGLVLRINEAVVLGTDAADRAVTELGRLPQPFSVADARQQLGTTRRVAVPLLEWMQQAGLTRRVGDQHELRVR